eukprot:CAMPEP_0170543788 /NCGR_PEP_ID=MMETSP0211-20121228/2783_1 /TAXON_ID=311385 /ORGANISM="Pseudokeronopsis sp., Strain OXSARD2" /LENGTH=35 /DNA_ID= /DNA_START= /DNA_END= /DNA_ORIENTATION=
MLLEARSQLDYQIKQEEGEEWFKEIFKEVEDPDDQ